MFQYKKWTVSKSLFLPGKEGEFDDVAVKDPTIVFYNGKYHMFYTSKASKKAEFLSLNKSGYLLKILSSSSFFIAYWVNKTNVCL